MAGKSTFQNNEIVFGIAIISVLLYIPKLDITKALLINTILSYSDIRKNLKNTKYNARSIEELIIKNNLLLTNFNQRFIENIETAINAIFLMKELELLTIEGTHIKLTNNGFDFNNKTLGTYASECILCSKKLAAILDKEDASKLYLCLQVEL